MLGKTLCNYLVISVASNCLSSRTHRHVFVSRDFVQVMRTISSRSVSSIVGGACAGDGSLRPVSCNMTRFEEVLCARCACSCHVSCSMVGSAQITFSGALMLRTHLLLNFKHVVGFECHDFPFECCLQLLWFQTHLMIRNVIDLFECGAN